MKQLILILLLVLLAGFIDLKPMDLLEQQTSSITVTIDGAVENPGELQLDLYASEKEALDLAKPLANADLSSINEMTILKDKDIIHIPYLSEEEVKKVSINTGSLQELCTLSGIGEGTANKIITYRQEHGLFQTVEELMDVSGIGQAKFEKIVDQICL